MQSNGLTAVVLAAGVGSRLDPLTQQLPKPLIPFANRPVMEHILNLLKRHGVSRTISNVHYLREKVKEHFCSGTAFGVDMSFVDEPQLSGDAGGMRACREYITEDTFIVIMGDLITDMDISYVINQHREKEALATIALKQVEDVERFGVAVLGEGGFVKGFQEKPKREEAQSRFASTGVYVFERSIFDHMPKYGPVGFGRELFPYLIEKQLPLLGVETWGYWSDVGTIEQYRRSTLDVLEGLVDIEVTSQQIAHGGTLLLGCNSRVADDVIIKGYAVIGDNCVIERGVELQDTIIWPGTTLGAFAKVRASVIGMDCDIPAGEHVLDTAIVDTDDLQAAA